MRKLALVTLAAVSAFTLGGCSLLGECLDVPLGVSVGRSASITTVMPAVTTVQPVAVAAPVSYVIPAPTPYPIAAVQPMPTVMPYSAYAAPVRPQLSK